MRSRVGSACKFLVRSEVPRTRAASLGVAAAISCALRMPSGVSIMHQTTRRRGDVGMAPRGVEGVDAQNQLARAIAAGGERGSDDRSGASLRFGRHRIL